MCYRISLKTGIKELASRFRARLDNPDYQLPADEVNGFTFAAHPILTDSKRDLISTDFHWGLIPHWSKDEKIRTNTLNARAETLADKPAFRDAMLQRCLVPVTSFYEWRWLDDRGKAKQKYEIGVGDEPIFSLGGIWSVWTSPEGELQRTFSIVTIDANPLMSYIHNTKKRMPLILDAQQESKWLDGLPVAEMEIPELIAFKL